MNDTRRVLRRYRTAYSAIHGCYVAIVGVYEDSKGEDVVQVRVNSNDGGFKALLRPWELTGYCL